MAILSSVFPVSGLTLFLIAAVTTASPLSERLGETRVGRAISKAQVPEMELELENLKTKNESQEGGRHDAIPGLVAGNQTATVKSELNLEKPTVSDNSAPESFWDSLDQKRGDVVDMSYSYAPHDIAEYIFWTGDDKGVTLAIEELIDNEAITKEDSIDFLRLVESELQNLRNRYDRRESNKRPYIASRLPERNKISLTSLHLSAVPKFSENHSTPGIKSETVQAQAPEKFQEFWNDYGEAIPKAEVIDNDKEREFNVEKEIQELTRDLFSKSPDENPRLAMQMLARFVRKLIKPSSS